MLLLSSYDLWKHWACINAALFFSERIFTLSIFSKKTPCSLCNPFHDSMLKASSLWQGPLSGITVWRNSSYPAFTSFEALLIFSMMPCTVWKMLYHCTPSHFSSSVCEMVFHVIMQFLTLLRQSPGSLASAWLWMYCFINGYCYSYTYSGTLVKPATFLPSHTFWFRTGLISLIKL